MGGVKNEQDLRYRKREKKIFGALIRIVRGEEYAMTVRPSRVYREAGVSRSTFRRHYRQVGEILEKKDRELLREFRRGVGDDLKTAWRKTLIFIVKNREVFEMKFVKTDDRLLRKMVEYLDKKLNFGWMRYGARTRSRIFEMFYAEVVGIINIWAKEGMKIENVERMAVELVHLATTAEKKWGPVMTDRF